MAASLSLFGGTLSRCVCICLCNFCGGSVRRKTVAIQTRAICLLHITFNYYCIKQRQGFHSPNRCEWICLSARSLAHLLARAHPRTTKSKHRIKCSIKEQRGNSWRGDGRGGKSWRFVRRVRAGVMFFEHWHTERNAMQCNDIRRHVFRWNRTEFVFYLLYESKYIGGWFVSLVTQIIRL